ncbi:hypothetical protein ACOSP7_017359 [Xanthoceras sorbifolium]
MPLLGNYNCIQPSAMSSVHCIYIPYDKFMFGAFHCLSRGKYFSCNHKFLLDFQRNVSMRINTIFEFFYNRSSNLPNFIYWYILYFGKVCSSTPWLTTFVRLVASKKQLLIVHFLPTISRAKVCSIDLERLKWVEVEDLGDEALFLGAWMSSKSGSTTNWRGLRNCVYHLPFGSNTCNIYKLNGESRRRFQICEPDMTHKIYCWYFLHQAYSPNNIRDEN